ncbi:MAG: hypothetical protein PF495_01660, partial [Spirochaetales bacterium]|nr:hypothetical protein [Spirochaetales bacterium]
MAKSNLIMINKDRIAHMFGLYSPKPAFTAATVSEVLPPKTLPRAQQTSPSYLKSAPTAGNTLPETDRGTANLDINTFRNSTSTKATIRSFAQTDPDMSSAVSASLRMGITKSYTLVAYNMDGLINDEATRIAQQLAMKFDFLSDYSAGYARFKDIRSISESLGREILIEGSCAMELVLDKQRYPAGFKAISTSQIDWKTRSDGSIFPIQVLSGEEVNLDTPLFFYAALDQDLLEPYSSSQLEAALHATIAQNEFFSDLRRVFRKTVHPRMLVTIIEDLWRKTIPADVLNDPDKLKAFRTATVNALQSGISQLRPQDAMVVSDVLKVDTLNSENSSTSDEYKTLSDLLNQKSAAGTKTLGTILGHSSASNNIASTESMLYLKNIEGSMHAKLNTIFSQAFTLAVRLYGQDCVVKFRYQDIDLRPELETEAFKAMKQSRILEQLSLGLISDAEASILLTGSLPPVGFKPLTGTFFKAGVGAADPAGNPNT